ncbi:MAG: STAS domain-containing protein [Spirochaetes bacterium]|nr:STAS domain-containing protein [Spirochaetota bacterium]
MENLDYTRLIFKLTFENVINSNNVKVVSLFLDTLIAGGAKKLIVNIKNLEFIDISGIGAFIFTAKNLERRRARLFF